ncbi:MerR family transcriptional regulator [Dietzia aurantiaca]|uniref:MerR family transcriptional regulator n=1 Tax=Dietzia aurantiaca TaxID=983873 RepID=UPI001E5B9D98|nr:MerR family transcriptional regulator [Dietzia aurantiaca]MCD2263422.1 MerR family transcriptional regulator [Dietzia aurantiaca]
MKIGEVAERTALSIRSLRHYDELGLVSPSAHSPGGFRLYTEADVERLLLIRRMKPLGFSLDRMKDFCRALDARSEGIGADGAAGRAGGVGAAGGAARGEGSDDDNAAARTTITEIGAEAAERLERLRKHLAYAEEFVEIIDRLS